MWRLAFALLLATSVLQRRPTAVLAEEDEAESSNTRERPVYTDGCYLAFLEEGMSKEETDRFYQNVEQEAKRGLNVTKMAELREATSGFVFMGDNTSAEEVSRMRGVSKVIPDYSVQGQSIEWHLDRIDQRCSPLDNHNYLPNKNGTAVDIYVLDSGANFNYSDIKDRLIYPGVDLIDEDQGVDEQRGSDCNGHGSHINSLAAGSKYGVAPGANVIVVRVLDCSNIGPFSAVFKGIELVLKMYRQRGNPAVASMSFLAEAATEMDTAVQSLITAGVVVVVAAGNYRKSACVYSPARMSQVISVGATREERDEVYWFDDLSNSPGSNYGRCVDIFAPGQWIYSAGLNCRDCATIKSGTSMATPLVSGAAALLLQEHPSFTPAEVKAKLLEMSTKLVIDFTQLADRKLALETPNRLLYVVRQDGMEATCTTAQPETTPTRTALPTPPSPSRSNTPTHSGTLYPTSTPTTTPPTPQPLTGIPTSPHSPSPSQPTTTTAPTRPPVVLHLRGTIISKDATDSCVAQPLDLQSPVVYDSLPEDRVREYHQTFWERGYTLTYLTSFRTAHDTESRYITIFAQKDDPNTVTRLKMNIRDMVITALRLRAQGKYFFKDFAVADEVDSNGAKSTVFSGVFVKDPNIISQRLQSYSASSALRYLKLRNGSAGVSSNIEVQHVSGHRLPNGHITFYVVTQHVTRPHRKFTLLSITLAEARHAINEFHKQGQYLESFQSYWDSADAMLYNLVFTEKTRGTCNYKVIMDTDRPTMMENRKLLINDGWVPALVSTHLSNNGKSRKYITVWWK